MKRIITAVAVIFLMAATSFSQTTPSTEKTDNEKWLDNYEALVERIKAVETDEAPSDSISQWRTERANIRTEYKDIYKDFLSESESERYFSLNAQYTKALAKFRLNNAGSQLDEVGEKLSDVGENVKDKAKKVGNKISGWFKGLKK